MIRELNHFGIMVDDLDKTLEFYQKLDGVITFSFSNERGVRIAYIQIAGSLLEFVCLPREIRSEGFQLRIDHLAFEVTDLDSDYQRLIDAGCTADGGTRPANSGRGRLGFLRRPDGARIELLQREDIFRVDDAPDGIITALDHYAYQVEDLEEAETFFRDVVGLTPLTHFDNADGVRIRSFFSIGTENLGLRRGTDAPGGPFPLVVFRVEDVDAALAALAARGIEPVEPASDSRSGRGRAAVLVDPDGVRLELLDRPGLRDL